MALDSRKNRAGRGSCRDHQQRLDHIDLQPRQIERMRVSENSARAGDEQAPETREQE